MTIVLPVPGTASAAALLLRPWRSDDLPALLAAHRDPELRRWLSTSLTGEAQGRRWLDQQRAGWAAATRFSFAVVTDMDDVSPRGLMAVTVGADGGSEVGYWTAAHARRQGVAARALEAVSRWALGIQDLAAITRLDLFHTVANEASCRVAVTCGYGLRELLPAAPPTFPERGHRHLRAHPGRD
jgi:RimJ/RimL family protein N-acetyltransferase